MEAIRIPEPVNIVGLQPDEEDLMAAVIDALKNWDHQAAKVPWSLLIESRARSSGLPGDQEIKHLIWMALRKACLTCASKDENEYLHLVADLANAADDSGPADIELQHPIQKEQELAQMVFTISKKLYDTAMTVIQGHRLKAGLTAQTAPWNMGLN